ncbi:MFS transporter [Photobacterium sp. TY1-4]|uniref:MFS transporter n=1 Tax=Photobacterium sp. TY1-4 TaxID=2899122 RepID=UPI0021BF44CE|nr:MFS transporter [Photobacterium sp. TY1-4]UXI03562.1 MFS transporter [Photobacterium sp. TY1-4]
MSVRKLSDNHPLAYFFLAFIAMAGLSYINYLPSVVNALAGGLGFSDAQAGQVVALNGYGGLLGSTIAIFLVRRIHWQPAMYLFLALLAVIDIGTLWVDHYGVMLGWRFLAGTFGGLCVGIGFSVLACLNNPDRAFGTLLLIQFSIGSLVIYGLPALKALLNAYAVFGVMAGFVVLSLAMMPFLPSLPRDHKSAESAMPLPEWCSNSLLLMLAITVYQIAASAVWAYVGLIGLGAGIDVDHVSLSIAATGLLGLLGAMLPVISGKRFGRLYWVIAGGVLSVISALLLSMSPLTPLLYVTAMALLFFSWPAVQSYLLAVTAEMDRSGRLSTIAAVVSSVGLASGPLLASSLLDHGNFTVMLYACALTFLSSCFLVLKPVLAQEKTGTEEMTSQYQ